VFLKLREQTEHLSFDLVYYWEFLSLSYVSSFTLVFRNEKLKDQNREMKTRELNERDIENVLLNGILFGDNLKLL
jgi:hypothetical protein